MRVTGHLGTTGLDRGIHQRIVEQARTCPRYCCQAQRGYDRQGDVEDTAEPPLQKALYPIGKAADAEGDLLNRGCDGTLQTNPAEIVDDAKRRRPKANVQAHISRSSLSPCISRSPRP
jgi:hypothetical protein